MRLWISVPIIVQVPLGVCDNENFIIAIMYLIIMIIPILDYTRKYTIRYTVNISNNYHCVTYYAVVLAL